VACNRKGQGGRRGEGVGGLQQRRRWPATKRDREAGAEEQVIV